MNLESRLRQLERASGDGRVCKCPQQAGQTGLRVVLANHEADSDPARLCVVCGKERPVFEVGVTLETWELV